MDLPKLNDFLVGVCLLSCGVNQTLQSTPVENGELASQSGELHTKVALVADVAAVPTGKEFTVGVLLTIDKGWHTYWQNAGDAGLPTKIEWTLPKGFKAGEIQWPIPRKHIETGDVLTFGYENESMLLVKITPPDDLAAGTTIRLKADVNWLECQHTCVPGNASVALALPVTPNKPAVANRQLFEKYSATLPRSLSADSNVSIEVQVGNAAVEFRLRHGGSRRFVLSGDARPDFYPGPLEELAVGRSTIAADGEEALITYPLFAYRKVDGPLTLRGVLVYQLESGERRGVGVDVPMSADFCRTIPVAGEHGESPLPGLLERTFTTTEMAGGQQPLALYLGLAVIGGLLLNIMPCVLPVIALKIFGLVKMAGDKPRRITRLGWSFSLGVLSSFLVLALFVILLQQAGQQVGWGFQFQEPLFVIAMSAIVFAFGLSLFGVYEIRLPGGAIAGVSQMISNQEQGGKGYAASFAEGVFATILATPCTAPFLGSALGFAFSRPPGIILLIFASVAVGMALPYLVLTARPAWLKFLPKPGEWMETGKQFMGFLMMATMLWLLYIIGKQLGTEGIIWTSAFILSVGLACWLVGRFATLTASRSKVLAIWIVAAALVVVGYWGFLEMALDVRGVTAGVLRAPGDAVGAEGSSIQWQPFSVAGLEARLKENRTVFVDFTAEWCLTCKVNEKGVLANNTIVNEFRSAGIVAVRADWTNRNPDITRLLAKFGKSGVPLYVIFPAGKPDRPIVLPEVITPGIVLDALRQVAEEPN